MQNIYVHIIFNPYMPDNRIALIKHLRAVFGCGLYAAKKFTEECGIFKPATEGIGWQTIGATNIATHGGVIVKLTVPEHIKPFDPAWRIAVDEATEYFRVAQVPPPTPIAEL